MLFQHQCHDWRSSHRAHPYYLTLNMSRAAPLVLTFNYCGKWLVTALQLYRQSLGTLDSGHAALVAVSDRQRYSGLLEILHINIISSNAIDTSRSNHVASVARYFILSAVSVNQTIWPAKLALSTNFTWIVRYTPGWAYCQSIIVKVCHCTLPSASIIVLKLHNSKHYQRTIWEFSIRSKTPRHFLSSLPSNTLPLTPSL